MEHNNKTNQTRRGRILPDYAIKRLNSCPSAGDGVHSWLFKTARAIHHCFPDKNQLVDVLERAAQGNGRTVPRCEVVNAVVNSEASAWRPGGAKNLARLQISRKPSWPERDTTKILSIVSGDGGLAEFRNMSPGEFDECDPEPIIDALFPGNPLVCVAINQYRPVIHHREQLRGRLNECAFIVPNPMTAKEGINKEGKPSVRCLNNTGERHFVVVECDFSAEDEERFQASPLDMNASILLHLAERAPLMLVVYSGNKSLHGWFACKGQPEHSLKEFMRYAVRLGADHATWLKCQLVRMPAGVRDSVKRQTIKFFNREVLP